MQLKPDTVPQTITVNEDGTYTGVPADFTAQVLDPLFPPSGTFPIQMAFFNLADSPIPSTPSLIDCSYGPDQGSGEVDIISNTSVTRVPGPNWQITKVATGFDAFGRNAPKAGFTIP